MRHLLLALAFSLHSLCRHRVAAQAPYNMITYLAGQNFLSTDHWSYYGNYDNLTNGDVIFVNQSTAVADNVTAINAADNVILRIDNTTDVPYNEKRNAIYLTSTRTYPVGSVFILDAYHIPYGCSVWPAFFTQGENWPDDGEIDILETINLMSTNQYALHTVSGCSQASSVTQTGSTSATDCQSSSQNGTGCTVLEASTSAVGASFAENNGGIYACEFASSGIKMWFFPRASVPNSLKNNDTQIDLSDWGTPSAYYPSSSCDISKYFGNQYLNLDITLCGDWAGSNSSYNGSGCTIKQTCYLDNVITTAGNDYANAYFEIASMRAYLSTSVKDTDSSSSSSTTSESGARRLRPPFSPFMPRRWEL